MLVDRVEQDCETLLALDPDALDDEALAECLDELAAHQRRVEARFAACVGEIDSRGLWARDGALSPGAWLARRCSLSGAGARSLVRTTRTLRTLPATAEAVANGTLPLAKAALIARASGPRTRDALVDAEAELVEQARDRTVDDTAVLMAAWKARADQNGPAPGTEAERLHLSQTFGGRFFLNGELEAENGAIVNNELDRLAEKLYRTEDADEAARRSVSERRAAALVEMARRSLAAEPQAPALPLVMVLADIETLAGRAGRGAEIVGAGPISAETARRLACEANLVRILTGPEGEILDLGRSTKIPTRAQRRALIARDGGCAIPGCDRPPGWCAAHHLQHWTKDGPTDLCNLCLLCVRHHHLVHEGGFGLARAPNGELIFSRPDGSVIEPRPWAA